MTIIYPQTSNEEDLSRYTSQWETSIFAATMKAAADLTEEETRGLLQTWLIGTFNASGFGIEDHQTLTHGTIEWIQAGPTQFDCIYTGYRGLKCSLARVYEQPNGSWASMVIAGVKDDHFEALAAAEWAVSRLTSHY